MEVCLYIPHLPTVDYIQCCIYSHQNFGAIKCDLLICFFSNILMILKLATEVFVVKNH